MVIKSGGNVGIGTTSPVELLQVEGNNATIQTVESGGATVKMRSGSSGRFGTYSNHNLAFVTNTGDRMTITSTGNVGIGETSPDGKLHVHQTGSGTLNTIITEDDARKIFIGRDAINCKDLNNNPALLFLNQGGGNVTISNSLGIGTTSPSAKLHVSSDSGGALSEVAHFVGGGSTDDKSQISVGGNTSSALVSFGFRNTGSGFGYIANASDTEIITIDGGNERVGIGTASPASKLEVDGGDIEVDDSASGLILRSPNGTRYRIQVDNSGNLTTTAV